MKIGINASSAFKPQRTGVEEYTYQLIKNLAKLDVNHQVILYLNKKWLPQGEDLKFISNLPKNFSVKYLSFPALWTQLRLAGQMLFSQPDVLFIPVHVLPMIHPQNSVVTIHGLEYKYYPQMYPFFHLRYLHWATKYAARNASKIITISENTKKDLIKFYKANPDKIEVVYHGINQQDKYNPNSFRTTKPYFLFIGRLETKKNIINLVKAFNKLKEDKKISHQLILVGKPGYGYNKILKEINRSPFKKEIVLTNYISEKEKNILLDQAQVFVYPSFYEGFGIPILEAMAHHCPVITSNVSCLPEIAGRAALLVEPKNIDELARAMGNLIADRGLRLDLIEKGFDNLKRFSWQKCAQQTWQILTSVNNEPN